MEGGPAVVAAPIVVPDLYNSLGPRTRPLLRNAVNICGYYLGENNNHFVGKGSNLFRLFGDVIQTSKFSF